MSEELIRLHARLSHIEAQMRGHQQMIDDAHLWGARVSVAVESLAHAKREHDQLIQQIAAHEALENAPRGRLHS